jgi:hypothetical protein
MSKAPPAKPADLFSLSVPMFWPMAMAAQLFEEGNGALREEPQICE